MTTSKPLLRLGSWRQLTGAPGGPTLHIPAHHLVTHTVVVGMTGSGKTGLLTVLSEEALSAGIPLIVIDVKGDLPNLLLTFPSFDPKLLEPWVDAPPEDAPASVNGARLAALATERQDSLSQWSLAEP